MQRILIVTFDDNVDVIERVTRSLIENMHFNEVKENCERVKERKKNPHQSQKRCSSRFKMHWVYIYYMYLSVYECVRLIEYSTGDNVMLYTKHFDKTKAFYDRLNAKALKQLE